MLSSPVQSCTVSARVEDHVLEGVGGLGAALGQEGEHLVIAGGPLALDFAQVRCPVV